jgi:hypothetical protein
VTHRRIMGAPWLAGLVVVAIYALAATSAQATGANYSWQAAAGDWSVADNWGPAGPPTSADFALAGILTANPVLNLDADASVGWLDLRNGASFNAGAHTLTVLGNTKVDAASRITGNGTINFNSADAAALQLGGELRPDGGTLTLQMTGAGMFALNGPSGAGKITVTSPASQLVVDGPLAGAFAGTMTIGQGNTANFTRNWATSGTVDLQGGQVIGGNIQILSGGSIHGWGTVAAAGLDNNGKLIASGGDLVLNTTNFPDIDGGQDPEIGQVEAIDGNVYVKGNWGGIFAYNTQLTVGAGHFFQMDHYGLNNLGQMRLQGGTYNAPWFWQKATLTVSNAPSTLQSDSTFKNGGTTTLNADLRINGRATFETGAVMTGPGALVVLPGSTMTGVINVGVGVNNQGLLDPGTSTTPVALCNVKDCTQSSTGKLRVDVAGLQPGSFDRVSVTGTATVGGELAIALAPAYAPNYLDEFNIITAGAVAGRFSSVTGYQVNTDMSLAAVYQPTSVKLVAAYPGDANFDGKVNLIDLTILAKYYGGTVHVGDEWQDGDFNQDGKVNLIDLTILAKNYGKSMPGLVASPPLVGAMVPEPTTVSLLAIGCAALARRRRA